jgi:hypothetical protein
MKKPNLKALSVTHWTVIEIFDTDVPGLVELIHDDGHPDRVHGGFHDILVRHGDDGGWCVNALPRSKLHNYLERIRVAADYPDHGEVFYLLVKRA